MKFSLDSFVLRDNRIFAYGWAFDPIAKTSRARLLVRLIDGKEVSLPLSFGKVRPDVADAFPAHANARYSGWMAYAAWAGAAANHFSVVGMLEDGREFKIPLSMPSPADASGSERPRLGLLGRLRRRCGIWIQRCHALLSGWGGRGAEAYLAPALDKNLPSTTNLVEGLLSAAGQRRCALVIDHDMGGGANHFRREWVDRLLTQRPFVLVLTFELATQRYVLDVITSKDVRRHGLREADSMIAFLKSGLVDRLLYNDAVSFPRPEDVPVWLMAFKEVPETTLTMAVHDYFAVCPSQFLLNDGNRFCRIPSMEECLGCLPVNENEFSTLFTSRSMPEWRACWGSALASADEILCFSPSSKTLILRAYPTLKIERIQIVPHTIATFDRLPRIDYEAPMHIGVVGAIGVHKGARVIEALAQEILHRGLAIKITIIGIIDLAAAPRIVETTGPYVKAELPALIENSGANVFLLPSICPETFSYVTQELMALHVPLVSFDFGAPAERVSVYPLGRVLPLDSSASLLDGLLKFHLDIVAAQRQETA